MEMSTPTCHSSKWTPAENKAFENALAEFDTNTPDRWQRVAAMVAGKSVTDVIRHFGELEGDVSNIEAGLVPIPGYSNRNGNGNVNSNGNSNSSSNTSSSFTLAWGSGQSYDALNHYSYGTTTGTRSSSSTRSSNRERKKGVPWTKEEHRLFLMGLETYGKGDWRNISRKFVTSRTPTQVASHAQKYYIRQLSSGKEKRRASIHDITIAHLNDSQIPSPSPENNNRNSLSPEDSPLLSQQRRSSNANANATATSMQQFCFQRDCANATSTSMQQFCFQGDHQQFGFQGNHQQFGFQGNQQQLSFQGNQQPLSFQENQPRLSFQENQQQLSFQGNQQTNSNVNMEEGKALMYSHSHSDGVNSYYLPMPQNENIVQRGGGVQPYQYPHAFS